MNRNSKVAKLGDIVLWNHRLYVVTYFDTMPGFRLHNGYIYIPHGPKYYRIICE